MIALLNKQFFYAQPNIRQQSMPPWVSRILLSSWLMISPYYDQLLTIRYPYMQPARHSQSIENTVFIFGNRAAPSAK